eukprot:2019441-Ditylum_brightwellii.AAC.1
MRWESKELFFKVYYKKNKQLKYVDRLSMHRPSTFKSIAMGVLTHLGRLILRTTVMEVEKMDIVYPDHARAMAIAD